MRTQGEKRLVAGRGLASPEGQSPEGQAPEGQSPEGQAPPGRGRAPPQGLRRGAARCRRKPALAAFLMVSFTR